MSRLSVARNLFIAAIAATTAACTGSDGAEPVDFHADTGGPATENAAQPRVVAAIITSEGAAVTFMNENDPKADPLISVEISSPASTPILDAVLAQQPSALEMYLALQPGKAAPEELVREHGLLASADATVPAEPRKLATASPASTHLVQNVACGNQAAWEASFDAWAPVLDGRYADLDAGYTTGYVGYAPKFYFEVCRTFASPYAYLVQTQRRTNSGAAWGILDSAPLGTNQRYRFYRNSFSCSSYQYRLLVNSGGGPYFRGAKWADEWSCQISG